MKVQCACCEKSVDETTSVRLLHRPDIMICFDCLGWLNTQRERHDRAHSGGWVVSGSNSVLVVGDMPRAADHYAKLGFEVTNFDAGYAFADRGKLNLHLELAEEGGPPAGAGILYIHCEDAQDVADEWRKAGLEVSGPEDKPWGQNEGSHVDPDGNIIRFGSPRIG